MYTQNNLLSLKVAVVGLGVTGQAVLDFLIKSQTKEILVIDQNIEKIEAEYTETPLQILAQNDPTSAQALSECDLVILSPGIPRNLPLFDLIQDKEIKLIGEIEFAYQLFRSADKNKQTKIIAITGTNGKTTTVSFLDDIFQKANLNIFTCGNIGTPFIEILNEKNNNEIFDYVLLELSSFQLESIVHFKPDLGAILNLASNHGERYLRNTDYFEAKWNLFQNMQKSDLCLLPQGDSFIESKKNELSCCLKYIDVKNIDHLKAQIEKEFNLSEFKLIGFHNLLNLAFCLEIAKYFGISTHAIQKSINSFRGVEHRVELCESRFPFIVVNDAKSTNFEATLTAIKAMDKNLEIHLIMGGKLRSDFSKEVKPLISFFEQRVKHLYFIGEAAFDLKKSFEGTKIKTSLSEKLENVIEETQYLTKGCVLLFSPAFPSFDQFSNYAQRGKFFKSLVK